MIERMCGSGMIKAQLKTAGTGVTSTRTGLRQHPIAIPTGRSPGHMMPEADRAMLRTAISRATPATLRGIR